VELTGTGEDGVYNEDDIGEDGTVTADITLNPGTDVGDNLTVTDKDGNVLLERPVTEDDLTNGIKVEVPVQPGDKDVTVNAIITDPSGNRDDDSDTKPIDNVPPSVSVELTGTGEDGVYNEDDIGEDGTVTADVTLNPGTDVGDNLTVTDKNGNVLLERPVTEDDLTNGIRVEVPVQPGDKDVTVNAIITDPSGNRDDDSDTKPIDNIPPSVSVELTGTGEDGVYNEDDIGEDGTVTADITLNPGTDVGDNLTVTDKDGNVLLERPVTEDDLTNGIKVEVPVQPGDKDVTVNATITDTSGNRGEDTDTKPVDNVPPSVSVELTGTGEDGVYNEDDIGEDGTVTANITLNPGTDVGDNLTVTDKNGNVLLERPVTEDDLNNGIRVEVPVQPGDKDVTVNAIITDPSGNRDDDSDTKPIDNVPPSVSVELTGTGEDGVYNEDDIGEDGTVTADVTLNPGTDVGDNLTVTDKNGNVLLERPVTEDDLTNGIRVEVPVQPGDKDVTVNAIITDPSGNRDDDSDTKPIDDIPPSVSVELTGTGEDGIYNEDDIGEDGTVTADITLNPGTDVGDNLTVTDKDGNVLLERPVTEDDLTNGIRVEVPVQPGDKDVTVNATITDPSGNRGEDTDTKPIDDIPPSVSVELTGTGEDGIYNEDDIGEDGTVTADITLNPGTDVGDNLTVTDKDGNVLLERPVTEDDLTNGIKVEVPVQPGDKDVTVNATITDTSGNRDDDSDTKPIDDAPPVLVNQIGPQKDQDADEISLDISTAFDDAISGSELTYQALNLPEGLTIDPQTGVISGTIDNSASQGGNTGTPGDYNVTITVTDPAGNSSEHDFVWTVSNPAPEATNDKQTIAEDTVATGNVLTGKGNDVTSSGQDTDLDGDDLQVTGFTVEGVTYKPGETAVITGVGEITLNKNGEYTFTPEQDWNGTVPDIGYTITDGEGGEDDAVLTIVLTPVNDAPEAVGSVPDQVSEDDEQESVTLDLENIFKDVDNSYDELTFTVDGLPPGLSFDPSTGKITGTLDNSASQGGPKGDGKYQVTITATDPEGGSTNQNFEWTVTNPVPEAVNDAGDTSKNVKLTVNAEEGVLNNDSDPDGDDLTVVGVVPGGAGEQSAAGVDTEIKGEFGTLILQPDGSYTYTPDLSNDTVWTLPEGSQLTDSFTYTISDGEGGFATAELVINITGHSNTPPFLTPNDANGPSIAGEITVYEKGLQGGTEQGVGHIASGTIDVVALDGLTSITIAGQEITLSQLQNLAESPITINVPGGSITLTGFDPMTAIRLGVEKTLGGKLSYDYQLTQDQDHISGDGSSLVLDIQLGVKDDQGAISVADDNKLIVNVIDDAPVADHDINAITEDNVSVTANVLDNDSQGADGALVTGVQAGAVADGVDVADGNLGTDITGKYGTLTLNPDGSYSYKLDNSNLTVQGLTEGEALNDEVFSYTITDQDGDKSTATITITINGTDDGVTVDVPNEVTATTPDADNTDQVVFESGLTDGSAPDLADTQVSNQFTLVALDGLADVIISYTDVNGQPATLTLSKAQVDALGTTSQTITTQYGELVLNGVSQGSDGTLTIDYDYTLTTAPGLDVEATNDTFIIAANDRNGDTAQSDLTIKIVDDAPVANDDANSVTEDMTLTANGNVISNGSTGDVADTTGADNATVTGVTSTNVASNIATESNGTLVIEGQYGTLTINADGSYSYALDNSNLDVQELTDTDTLEEVFNYTLTDGDGDEANADLTITINGSNDGVTVDVPNEVTATTPDADNTDQVVFESGLTEGSSPNALDTQVSSQFTLVALDGLAENDAVTVTYTDASGAQQTLSLSKAQVEGLAGTNQTITTQYGELVLNGVSQGSDGTLTIDYDYVLTTAPGLDVEATNDTFTIAANDRNGDTAQSDLTIKIVDDAPVANDDANSVTEGANVDSVSTATGNVIGGNDASVGDVADTTGADGATVTGVTSNNVASNTATESNGTLVIEGQYGTLTINADGTYTYQLDNSNLDVQELTDTDTLEEVFNYTL
ncbi:beta strand repeat-containing protein, partial [Oceanimonas smirnovii]|uniref:beta strand repeat-containing protein n=1 Tax=Oceanimonas smirnovii TaxID=264574 RepID=UPI0037703FB7